MPLNTKIINFSAACTAGCVLSCRIEMGGDSCCYICDIYFTPTSYGESCRASSYAEPYQFSISPFNTLISSILYCVPSGRVAKVIPQFFRFQDTTVAGIFAGFSRCYNGPTCDPENGTARFGECIGLSQNQVGSVNFQVGAGFVHGATSHAMGWGTHVGGLGSVNKSISPGSYCQRRTICRAGGCYCLIREVQYSTTRGMSGEYCNNGCTSEITGGVWRADDFMMVGSTGFSNGGVVTVSTKQDFLYTGTASGDVPTRGQISAWHGGTAACSLNGCGCVSNCTNCYHFAAQKYGNAFRTADLSVSGGWYGNTAPNGPDPMIRAMATGFCANSFGGVDMNGHIPGFTSYKVAPCSSSFHAKCFCSAPVEFLLQAGDCIAIYAGLNLVCGYYSHSVTSISTYNCNCNLRSFCYTCNRGGLYGILAACSTYDIDVSYLVIEEAAT